MRVGRDQAEVVLAELLELAPAGVEERSLGDLVEYAVYGQSGELPALPDLLAVAGPALVEVRSEQIADDFSERWRAFHRPLVLEGKLTVRPPWEPPASTPIDLVIDPGQAFGTGAHPTTRLCLELMVGMRAEGPFLDLGCGSGVLAIAAARLGWAPVIAIDNDQASVQAAIDNARRNAVELDVRRSDLRREALPDVPTVAANLLAPLLVRWAQRLGDSPSAPHRIIASGLLSKEARTVLEAFSASGLRAVARRRSGEWTALLLERAA